MQKDFTKQRWFQQGTLKLQDWSCAQRHCIGFMSSGFLCSFAGRFPAFREKKSLHFQPLKMQSRHSFEMSRNTERHSITFQTTRIHTLDPLQKQQTVVIKQMCKTKNMIRIGGFETVDCLCFIVCT